MMIIDSQGVNLLEASLAVNEENQLCTHTSFAGGAAELDLPKLDVSFESEDRGLLVHVKLSGTDKACDMIVEYGDMKALKSIPGKGLVKFVLKAFR